MIAALNSLAQLPPHLGKQTVQLLAFIQGKGGQQSFMEPLAPGKGGFMMALSRSSTKRSAPMKAVTTRRSPLADLMKIDRVVEVVVAHE